MARRNELFGVALVAVVCLVLIAFSQRPDAGPLRRMRHAAAAADDDAPETNASAVPSIGEVLRLNQELLEDSLADYRYAGGAGLRNFSLGAGGRPARTLILTTWRSGSTFLGDVFNALPGTFYHYEPLLDYGMIQIRGPPHADSAIRVLKSLLNCDYSDLQNYLEFGRSHVYLFTHNTRLWRMCKAFPAHCWNATFLNGLCSQHLFQTMKIVRLRLRLAEDLLKDEKLNVKVVLLVRDPRGTLQSRRHRDWCPGQPDCDMPNLLCADMVADYSAAIRLQRLYPGRFRAIRYEDLSLDPFRQIKKLFDFIGLYFHPDVRDFLESHTKINVGGVSSTFRNSKNAPFHWRFDLNFSEVEYIEEYCDQAMKLWGYRKAWNETHLRSFDPLDSYSIA